MIDNLSGRTFGKIHVNSYSHMKYNGANKRHGVTYYNCTCSACGEDLVLARSNIIQHKWTCKTCHHNSIKE